MVETFEDAIADATQARSAGATLVEYRIDDVFHGDEGENTTENDGGEAGGWEGVVLVRRLVAESPLPCIVTCRSVAEGGGYDGDDDARIALYESLARDPGGHPPRYIDVEYATFSRSANIQQKVLLAVGCAPTTPRVSRDAGERSTSLVLSHHDFEGRPANLMTILSKMQRVDAARVLKIAFQARSVRDNLEIFELLRERDRPMIALAMGEAGLLSRVLAPKFGGCITFASPPQHVSNRTGSADDCGPPPDVPV